MARYQDSYAEACQCAERKKPPGERNWVVRQRNCNHSAFSGYHYTPSDYSSVVCYSCTAVWRTKAAFVYSLVDETKTELLSRKRDKDGHDEA